MHRGRCKHTEMRRKQTEPRRSHTETQRKVTETRRKHTETRRSHTKTRRQVMETGRKHTEKRRKVTKTRRKHKQWHSKRQERYTNHRDDANRKKIPGRWTRKPQRWREKGIKILSAQGYPCCQQSQAGLSIRPSRRGWAKPAQTPPPTWPSDSRHPSHQSVLETSSVN